MSVCAAFHQHPTINPRTMRSIAVEGPTYKQLVKECGQPRSGTTTFVPISPRPTSTFIPITLPQLPSSPSTYIPITTLPKPTVTFSPVSPRPTITISPPRPTSSIATLPKLTSPIGSDIDPPEYMPETPMACEGYWGEYMPIPSTKVWAGKNIWLQKVAAIEAYIQSLPASMTTFPMNMSRHERDARRVTAHWVARGLSHSRLVSGAVVAAGEYEDNGICWPEGYVEHYIRDHNVMPTKRFYDYVNARYATLPK